MLGPLLGISSLSKFRKFLRLFAERHHCCKCIAEERVRCYCTRLSRDQEVQLYRGKENAPNLRPLLFPEIVYFDLPGPFTFIFSQILSLLFDYLVRAVMGKGTVSGCLTLLYSVMCEGCDEGRVLYPFVSHYCIA